MIRSYYYRGMSGCPSIMHPRTTTLRKSFQGKEKYQKGCRVPSFLVSPGHVKKNIVYVTMTQHAFEA